MPEETLVTSDSHFEHGRIIELAARPFVDTEAMTEALIEAWNSRVRKQDKVYHLGDFSFGSATQAYEVLRRLRGRKYFVRGNHDESLTRCLKHHPELAVWIKDYEELRIDGQKVVLMHFPILSWHLAHRGAWHLHGHTHGQLHPDAQNGPMMDVGVDCHADYAPFTWDEIRAYMDTRPEWLPVDQHSTQRQKESRGW